ncbi:MAG: hypothetical protein WC492_04175 [Candidatus Micrarchaeia archaeon]
MTSIRKVIISGGKEHYVQIDSSLDLEEIEITGTDSISGKTVHVSLSSLLKQPSTPAQIAQNAPAPLQMFDEPSRSESVEVAPVEQVAPQYNIKEEDLDKDVLKEIFD